METKFIKCESKKEAVDAAPGSAKIIKVEGGYMAFKTISDWEIWKNQK